MNAKKSLTGCLLLLGLGLAARAGAQTFTLQAAADTSLRESPANQNRGGDPTLLLAHDGRVLVRFDQSALTSTVGSGRLVSASLELFVHSASGWGAAGHPVEAHPLTAPWTEAGATWNCAVDTNPANNKQDCATPWAGGTFDDDASDTVLQTKDAGYWLPFDVTANVAAFLTGTPNDGWLIEKSDGDQNGKAEYSSREGAAAERPRLVLLVETAAHDVVPPSLAIASPDQPILVNEPSPTVVVQYADGGSGVDLATLQVRMDGQDVTARCTAGAQSASCPVSALAAGSHAIAAQMSDHAGNAAQASFAFQLLLGPGPHLVTFQAVGDTDLRKGDANKNFGAEPILRVREGGQNRALVQFDAQSLASTLTGATLVSASLELHIEKNGRNWGKQGRPVEAHRATAAWTELGATWNCPNDANPTNNQPDCATQWAGGSFVAAPTASVLHTRDLAGWVTYDVTADAAAFTAGTPNRGWLLKKADETQSGRVDYDSRQGTQGEAPRLVVVFTTAGAVDTTPPVLTIVSPSGTDVHATQLPPIVVMYSDAFSGVSLASLQVTLDGAALACTVGPAQATCPAPELTEGTHSVTARIRDVAGNPAVAETGVRISLDTAPPVISILAPVEGAFLSSLSPQVRASLADDRSGIDTTSVRLLVDDVDFTAEATITASSVTWSPSVPLSESGHRITVEASDQVGHRASASLSFTVDATLPVLTVDTPADGMSINGPSVTVTGAAADETPGLQVQIDGQPVTLSGGRFEVSLPLAEGTQAVTVQAVDVAGNVQQVIRQVTRFTLPEVVIASPPDLSYVAASTVSVGGTVSDPAAAVSVNGVPAVVSGGGVFTAADVPLLEGGNVVTATARDANGHIGTHSINVVRDLTPPQVVIHDPAAGAEVFTGSIAVSGMVNDIVAGTVNAGEVTVTVNGQPAVVENRSFLVQGLPLNPGDNVLTAVARDRSGNQGQQSITVHRETASVPRLVAVSGDLQQGIIGTLLAQTLAVRLQDAAGQPVAGRPVLFSVREGSGSFTGGKRQVAVTTGPDGRAEMPFTLGRRAGVASDVIEVSAAGFAAPAVFVASAQAGEPTWILVDSGSLQVGVTGQTLPLPLVAVVTDAGYNRLAGIAVRLRVVDGGGQFPNAAPEIPLTTDSDGRVIVPFVLGPDEGIANNVVEATIPGLDPSPKASFVATGRVAGDPAATSISGIVLDNVNQPVPGVTLRIKEQPGLTAVADGKGLFRIAGAPVGSVHLIVDGSTAERPGSWPDLEFLLTTVSGRDNTVNMPIYLLPIDLAGGILVDETHGGTLTLPAFPGFALEVQPGSVTFPSGSRSGVISVTVVHGDKVPMVPNFGQQPRFIVTIQPAGARFDPPARLVLPNVEGLAPGQVTEMYSFDHDLGHFVSIGPGTVSDDGMVIASNPGVGVIKAGWHCGGDPSATGTPADCPPCQLCDGNACVQACPRSLAAGGIAISPPFTKQAQHCTCDDHNPCTINDHCDGHGGCTGDPVQITSLDGMCAAPPSTAMNFTAQSNVPANVASPLRWNTGPAGSPSTGQGPSFTTQWGTKGGKAVQVFCNASIVKRKDILIFSKCSGGVTNFTLTPHTPTVPADKQGYFESTGVNFTTDPCTDSVADQYCLKLTKFESPSGYAVQASIAGDQIIAAASDSVITNDNCVDVLLNLTPVGAGEAGRPPVQRYWSPTIAAHHEQKHLQDWQDLVLTPTINELNAWLATKCQGCTAAFPQADVQAQFNTIYNPKTQAFDRVKEDRAYTVSNAEYQALADSVRARARQENWRQECR